MQHSSDRARIRHMIDAATEAIEYTQGRTRDDIEAEPPLRHLLIRDIAIMGEAASRISTELRNAHLDIPWHKMINTRNRLIHAYFDVDTDILWHTVRQALPAILPQLRMLLEELDDHLES